MIHQFTAILGLGNQELVLVSCSILFYGIAIWSVIDLISNTDYSALAKLIWIAVILFFPVFGTLFYLYYGRSEKHLSKNK